jgi:DNA-binding NtrC family response regulator
MFSVTLQAGIATSGDQGMGERRKRILVAVQDEALAVFVSEALTEEAYEVALCSDVVSLVPEIRRTRPQLILMDEEFGGNEKAALHKMVRRHLNYPPLIILWRGNRPRSCAIPGVEGFVLKSSNLGHLKQKIANLLGERSALPVYESPLELIPLPLIQIVFKWAQMSSAVNGTQKI